MAARWAKAVFMALLAMVLVLYGSGFVSDLETNAAAEWNMSFEWTWDLLTYLIWIIIAWLLVDAVIIVVLSFKMDVYSLGDVMDRLARIEKRLGPEKARPAQAPPEAMGPAVTVDEDREPPPPKE
ncbi:MAG: hypothetical protein AB1793_03730 [Candidatus Thermoplasmatota archaeon]